jgi:hypothetical protein
MNDTPENQSEVDRLRGAVECAGQDMDAAKAEIKALKGRIAGLESGVEMFVTTSSAKLENFGIGTTGPSVEPWACPVAEAVALQIKERAKKGLQKYGVNAARTDLTPKQWLQHLQEELLDASVYLERLKDSV